MFRISFMPLIRALTIDKYSQYNYPSSLYVDGAPPANVTVNSTSDNIVLLDRTDITLTCLYDGGTPPPVNFTWYKDGAVVSTAAAIYSFSTNDSSILGNYTCSVRNIIAEDSSPVFTLEEGCKLFYCTSVAIM